MKNSKYLKFLKKLEKKKRLFFNKRFTKYVVDYKIEDDNIRIYSNIGASRLVKNTKENERKLNKEIVKNKIAIASRIDEYGNTSFERLLVIFVNMIFLVASGSFVPFTFFMGNYLLFMLSIILFSFATLTTSIIGFNYYILIKEIKNLKKITGYKKDLEINISLKNIKVSKTK